MTMAAPKIKTSILKEEVLAVVAKYHRRGYEQKAIAVQLKSELKLDLSQGMISNYIKEIRKRYATSTQDTHAALVAEKVEQLNEVIAEAWSAYERSKDDVRKVTREKALRKPKEEVVVEKVKLKGHSRRKTTEQEVEAILTTVKVMVTREGRVPANEFLLTIIRAHELQMKLLGVLEDKVTNNNTVNVISVDWGAMAERSPLVDPMEQLPAIEVKALPQPSTNGTNGDSHHA